MSALNQPEQEEVQDDIQALIENNPCGMCRSMKLPVCKCKKGAGSSSGSGGSSGSNETLDKQASEPEQNTRITQSQDVDVVPTELLSEEGLAAQSRSSLLFDLEKLMDLLSFSNDSERGIIKLRPKPGLCLSLDDEKQVEELIRSIKMAFDQFKIALEKKGISVDGFTATSTKNELVIRIPSPKYFDAFVQKLVADNMLPRAYAPNIEQRKDKSSQFTPLAMTPSFQTKKERDEEEKVAEEEENSGFNPTPFSLKNILGSGRS